MNRGNELSRQDNGSIGIGQVYNIKVPGEQFPEYPAEECGYEK